MRAGRELLQDREQRPGRSARWKHTIVVLSWPVGAGTPWPTTTKRVTFSGWSSISAATTDEPVEVRRKPVPDRGQARLAGAGDLLDRAGRRVGRQQLDPGQPPFEPLPALAGRGRDRHDGAHVSQPRGRLRDEVERDRPDQLAPDEDVGPEHEGVDVTVDRALDRVLERHDGGVRLTALDRRDHLGNRPLRHVLGRAEVTLGEQRLFRERPARAEKSDPRHGEG